jgi:hypothetical protein
VMKKIVLYFYSTILKLLFAYTRLLFSCLIHTLLICNRQLKVRWSLTFKLWPLQIVGLRVEFVLTNCIEKNCFRICTHNESTEHDAT